MVISSGGGLMAVGTRTWPAFRLLLCRSIENCFGDAVLGECLMGKGYALDDG